MFNAAFSTMVLSWLFLVMFGCAHSNVNNSQTPEVSAEAVAAAPLSPATTVTSFHLTDSQAPEVKDEELETIPTEVNPLVEKWITYFQGRGHDHMERYLARSGRYEKLMKKVLRDNGLPEDLFYIALIESGFTARATSHASAVGYWQFIRGTGKRYGLDINKFVDERRDPVMATQAAAEYFKGLYSVFGSWYLSMASYNVGENRVKKEVMKNTTRDFWELAKKSRLPRETINYVPKFIAAKLIAKDPAKYGFDGIDYLPPVEFDTVTVTASTNLRVMSEKMNYNYEDFKALNPKFKGEVAPIKGGQLVLRIPPGTKEQALLAANLSVVEKVEYIADQGETEMYRIRKGDTLHTVARRYRTTVAYLRDLNELSKGKKLRIGMKLQVPDRTPLREKRANKVAKTEATPNSAPAATESASLSSLATDIVEGAVKYYIVQSGDSLFSIAQKYNTTVAQLKKLNNIRRGRTLKVGIKLKLPSDSPSSFDRSVERKSSQNSGRRPAKAKVHIVRRGETLGKIAGRYKVSMQELKTKNKFKTRSKVLVGERLFIPQAMAGESSLIR